MSGQRKKTKLDDSSDYSILNLNDDCLIEILTYLRLSDLCRVGGTCIRLNQIAQRFYSNYTIINETLFDYNDFADYDSLSMIIKQIGHHVESLHLDYSLSVFKNLILELVFKYCINLKELACDNSVFQAADGLQTILKSKIFQNLESIVLVDYTSYSTNLHDFVTIKNLKNFGLFSRGSFPSNKNEEFLKLHNLESLSVNVLEDIGYNICEKLFDNNPRIIKLNLFNGLNDEILNLLVDKLMYLEDLRLNEPNNCSMSAISDQAMMKISQIKNLKHFKSWKVPKCLLERLVQYDQLETLASSSEIPGELVTKFTKLKFLSITNVDDIVLSSLKSQKSLENLELSLIKFISGARNLKCLSLTSNFDNFQIESIIARLNSLFGNRQKKLQLCYYSYKDWKMYKYLIPTFSSRALIYSPSSLIYSPLSPIYSPHPSRYYGMYFTPTSRVYSPSPSSPFHPSPSPKYLLFSHTYSPPVSFSAPPSPTE